MNGMSAAHRPRLSVIAIFYDMAREAPRTLHSLSAAYQRDITAGDYEVIAIDNGSRQPLDPAATTAHGPNFRHIRIDKAQPSPAAAINRGVRESRGEYVGILIDGARIASPGLLAAALECLERHAPAVVGTVGFHLGPDIQTRSQAQGYNQQVEDELLRSIDWTRDGYRMFDACAPAGGSRGGWLYRIAESNLLFLPRAIYERLGGYDERFDLPGGGIVNLDFYKRACELADVALFTLLGEATFHQVHGGTMANRPAADVPRELAVYKQQYEAIRGKPYELPNRTPRLYGYARRETLQWLRYSADELMKSWELATTAPSVSTPPPADARPGDDHHRAYVGRAEHYDLAAGLQFSLLVMLGLREHHRLLDVGCGSLRGGRLFIPYLRPDGYFGLEPHAQLVEQGLAEEVGRDLARMRRPRFVHNDRFDLSGFGGTRFDFALAQSIFSHTGPTQLRQALRSVAGALAPEGVLVATFVERHEDLYKDEWVYPGLNFFAWKTIRAECERAGLHCAKLDWPHTLQTWFIATPSAAVLARYADEGPIDLLPDDVILTGARKRAREQGRVMRFLRHFRDLR
ncbi:glycosyltransferase [Fontimonas sp. SYSU GA230001]|uniref:glycosyltransferase n=1 Tax=Fontimonas sp. SYSU GA230001 TaxID=3142450 RepID=UPI0032B4A326